MAKLPRYLSQTEPQLAQVSPQAAGAGIGEATAALGGQLMDIGARSRERQDVIDRVRIKSEFDTQAAQEWETIKASTDITSGEALTTYKDTMRKSMEGMLAQHNRGSASSKAQLRSVMEQELGLRSKAAYGEHIKAQHTLIANTVEEASNSIAMKSNLAPEALNLSLQEFDALMGDLAPALYGEQETQYRAAGRNKIIQGSISGLLEQGNYRAAKAIMDNPDYNKHLDPGAARKFATDIIVDERKDELASAALNSRVAKFTMMAGRDLNPEQIARAKLLPTDTSDYTKSDHLLEYELVTGGRAPQNVIDKIMGAGSEYGDGLSGHARRRMDETGSMYAMGQMSREEARAFQADVTQVYQPVMRKNIAGEWVPTPISIPPLVQEMLDQGARYYGPINGLGGTGEATPTEDRTPKFEFDEGGEGIWQLATGGFMAGPAAGAARMASGLPVIGDELGISQKFNRAVTKSKLLQNNIVQGIKDEGRIANQYRQELQDIVTIAPKVWSNQGKLLGTLLEMELNLRKKLEELVKISSGATEGTTEMKKDALQLTQNIVFALSGLNIPRLNSPEELAKLPPGTYFVTPDDRIGRTKQTGEPNAGQ